MATTTFASANLKLASFELTPKRRELWTKNYALRHPDETGIVYATTRKKVEQSGGSLVCLDHVEG